jgi:hypothetical protein
VRSPEGIDRRESGDDSGRVRISRSKWHVSGSFANSNVKRFLRREHQRASHHTTRDGYTTGANNMCTYVSSCSAVVAVSASSPRTSSSTSGSCEKKKHFAPGAFRSAIQAHTRSRRSAVAKRKTQDCWHGEWGVVLGHAEEKVQGDGVGAGDAAWGPVPPRGAFVRRL